MKKRDSNSNKEIIESLSPAYESAYMKFTGENLIDVSGERVSTAVIPDRDKIESEISRRIKSGKLKSSDAYFSIHTHPYSSGQALPSPKDIEVMNNYHIHRTDKSKLGRHVEVIAARDENGKLSGYTMIFQRKKEHRDSDKDELEKIAIDEREYLTKRESSKKEKTIITPASEGRAEVSIGGGVINVMPQNIRYNRLKKDLIESGFDIRFYPSKGYHLNKTNFKYEPNKHSLECTVTSSLISIGLISLLFRFSITGSAISAVASSGYGLGIFALVASAFSLLIYFFRKRIDNAVYTRLK